MHHKRILALSSSRVGNSGYLEMVLPQVKELLGEQSLTIAFVPFAFVDEDTTPLAEMVRTAFASLPYTINVVTVTTGASVLENADAIMVSGGNTFKLLHDLYRSKLLAIVQQKVNAGTPYIGWSAGSNITGATISTTNDMPIIEPESFRALEFFPFHINPHYYNQPIEGFNGETRDQRLTEFIKLNSHMKVVCLPEGTALLLNNKKLELLGSLPGVLMENEDGQLRKTTIEPGQDLSNLLE